MAMNKPERVMQTRNTARRPGTFQGGVGKDMINASKPNESNQKCPIGQELITGPDGKKTCSPPRPRLPKTPNRGM